MEFIFFLIIPAAVCGIIGMAIGDLGGKKNGKVGFALGFLLGPIGWIIAAVLSPAADSDVVKAKESEKERIAKLELELQRLKSAPAVKEKPKPSRDLADEGGIPTYKLD